jgi:hypothetical protein
MLNVTDYRNFQFIPVHRYKVQGIRTSVGTALARLYAYTHLINQRLASLTFSSMNRWRELGSLPTARRGATACVDTLQHLQSAWRQGFTLRILLYQTRMTPA